jgi:CheY-like chemotaxis protein
MRSLRNKSVLIVDDNTAMVRALDRVLRGEGATVTPATEGAEAVEILTRREKVIDLVITDLRMPFINGMTLVYAIHEVFPELPVIVLTAFGSPDVKEECLRQGAVALLEKPLDTSELLAVIEDAFTPLED